MTAARHEVVIIGAGVSGIYQIKKLTDLGIDAIVLEGDDAQVGESLDLINAGNTGTDDYDFMPLCFHNQTLPGYATPR